MTVSPIQAQLAELDLPLIAAPMFLSSGPNLVVACCTSGIVGTFPAHNQRSAAGFEDWCYTQHVQSVKVIVDNSY